jgi:nicotinamidase-related amidase
MLLERESSVLLLIDLQDRLVPAIENGDAIVRTAGRLLAVARRLNVPVLATEHMAERIGGTVPSLGVLQGEVFDKAAFSAVRQTGFRELVTRQQVIICGSEAHVCVMQTALDLHYLGFAVAIVEDAIGSRYASDRDGALRRMQSAGLARVTAEMVMFEWLAQGDDPAFRDVLKIIKAR